MRKLIFHPDVKNEIKYSYRWYEKQAKGLGEDFLNELEASYQIIKEFSEAWPNFQDGFKRYVLAKFPFSIIYRKSGGKIYIIAVMHNRRKPGYWHKR